MNQKLFEWSQDQYHYLPWRQKRTLYTTLVSEIMLQQTTVSTVLNHFDRFLKKFPNIESLALATEAEVLNQWQGLGYYRRARNLKAAALDIYQNHAGEIPLDREKLLNIHGIGAYTASALISIGANKKELALDANLERVLARYYGLKEVKGPKLQKMLYEKFWAGEICKEIEEVGPRDFNEGLMDLGRVICQARKANCEICPLSSNCVALKQGDPLSYPVVKSDNTKKDALELHLLRVVVIKGDKVLAYQKPKGSWLESQYEIPSFSANLENFEQYPFLNFENYDLLPWVKTGITKYKILNFVIVADEKEARSLGVNLKNFKYIQPAKTHLSTGSLKSLSLVGLDKFYKEA